MGLGEGVGDWLLETIGEKMLKPRISLALS